MDETRSEQNRGSPDLTHTHEMQKDKGSKLGKFDFYKNKIKIKQYIVELFQLTPSPPYSCYKKHCLTKVLSQNLAQIIKSIRFY